MCRKLTSAVFTSYSPFLLFMLSMDAYAQQPLDCVERERLNQLVLRHLLMHLHLHAPSQAESN